MAYRDDSQKTAQQEREADVVQQAQYIVSLLKERMEWVSTEADPEKRAEMVDDLEYVLYRMEEELRKF